MAVVLASTTAGAVQLDGIGLKAGITNARLHAGDGAYQNPESTTDWMAGPFADVSLSRSVIFQPALVLVRRGGTFHDLPSSLTGTLGEIDELVVRRDYLELPLLLRWQLPVPAGFAVSLIAGPAVGWVVAYKVEEDGADVTQPFSDEGPLLRPRGGYDLALVLGVGLSRAQCGRQFSLDAVHRMASEGTRSTAIASGFEADSVDVTLGVRF